MSAIIASPPVMIELRQGLSTVQSSLMGPVAVVPTETLLSIDGRFIAGESVRINGRWFRSVPDTESRSLERRWAALQ